ncbi:peptidase M20 [Gordoniibacillus kamchatkensis]|uniref:Peptidase M20 n=1 Tax=Gordoniibacillus kamchatkensis TaxID=1590651 RepID=A0ABR5AL57_9BACL|nr:dipeptidase [Paenibacillus sp. VKM B-2647]KIL41777.1 peptidase M20 [Paenibacillus sp. VKM B-2647]
MDVQQQLEAYFRNKREAHLEELKQFLRIPSVSAVPEHASDIRRCAEWTADAFRRAGCEHVQIMPTAGHPVVYADWLHAPGKPTVLVYGHYDVQPPEPLELWQTPPFEPEIRDNKLYARGATDDKGPLFLYVKMIEAWLQTTGSLPVNVKFCIEGEEEVASKHTPGFVEANRELLAADVVVISDTPMKEKGQPAITYGLRGLIGAEIEVTAANQDLHSGVYGGGVPNALHALTALLNSFHSDDGKVAVAGFYDTVRPLSAEERASLAKVGIDEAKIRTELGLTELYGEPGYSFIERTTGRPTLEIVSVTGGFQGEGIKPIVPGKALAKITCRLVANQTPDEVMDLIDKHIASHTPAGVKAVMRRSLRGNPFLTPIDHPVMQAAAASYEAVYGKAPIFTRGGGSIPVVEVFSRLLDAPVVLMGLSLNEENMHAPNEYFDLDNFDMGLRTLALYWEKLGNLPK